MNAEELLLHATEYHSHCIKDKLRQLLQSQKEFLEDNGLYLLEKQKDNENPLVIRYRHEKYISIDIDSRTGKVKAYETKNESKEENGKYIYIYI